MRLKIITFLGLSSLMVGCIDKSGKEKSEIPTTYLETISIDVNKIETPTIDGLFSEIEIIPLSSTPESFYGQLGLIIPYKGLLFFRDMARTASQVFCFNSNGKFEWKVGEIGKGPGEISRVSDMWINPYRDLLEIYDRNTQKKNSYSLKGKFVESKLFVHYGLNLLPFTKNSYLSYTGASYNINQKKVNKDDNILTIDSLGKILESYLPADTPSRRIKYNFWQQLYYFKDSISFWFNFEDTVYRIGSQGPNPRFAFNYGSSKSNMEFISEDVDLTLANLRKSNTANSSRVMCETPAFLVFRYIINKEVIYAIYSKATKKCIQFKYIESPLQPKNFVPMNFSMNETDDLYFQVLAVDFIKQFPKFSKEVAENSKLAYLFRNLNDIKKLIPSELSEDSNSILLRCRLKKF
jgi:hypothetical protein